MMNKKGFTLVELMVVIVIIGILAAVALPRMNAMTDRARVAEVSTQLAAIENLAEAYRTATGTFPKTTDQAEWFAAIGFEAPEPTESDFVYTVLGSANGLTFAARAGSRNAGVPRNATTVATEHGASVGGLINATTGTVQYGRRSVGVYSPLLPNWNRGAITP